MEATASADILKPCRPVCTSAASPMSDANSTTQGTRGAHPPEISQGCPSSFLTSRNCKVSNFEKLQAK